jgi:hypothetical protein
MPARDGQDGQDERLLIYPEKILFLSCISCLHAEAFQRASLFIPVRKVLHVLFGSGFWRLRGCYA